MFKQATRYLAGAAVIAGLLVAGFPRSASARPERQVRRSDYNATIKATGRAIRKWVLRNPSTARRIRRLNERQINWDQAGVGLLHYALTPRLLRPLVSLWNAGTGEISQRARRKAAPLIKARTEWIRQELVRQGIEPGKLSSSDIDRSADNFVKDLPALGRAAAKHGVNLRNLPAELAAKLVEHHVRTPDGKISFPAGSLDYAIGRSSR
ncbi:MAG: hypothetical protein KC503_28195 [Myxococcales bacterium]|nr:hypothetical protein [Myxococcales bacterium]